MSEDIKKEPFYVYDIVTNTTPQLIFYYCCILIVIILIFTSITVPITLFIGLIGYSILIYYLWYSRNVNIVNNKDKFESKVNIVQPINKVQEINKVQQINNENPEIVDFLYYMRDLKALNFSLYDEINVSFSNIVFLYNSIKTDKNLVFDYYNIINTIKLQILAKIESYNLITNSITYNDKIKNLKNMAENIINKMLTELYEISKKHIYYNNYNNSTKIITKNNVLEYNILDFNNENIRNSVPFSASSTYVL
jgi:hypothetical protein